MIQPTKTNINNHDTSVTITCINECTKITNLAEMYMYIYLLFVEF